jgi:Xaa-Pro aminopeptidase
MSARRDRARLLLRSEGLDALVATPSSDLFYLTGYSLSPSERLTSLVLPVDGEAVLLVPGLEERRALAAVRDVRIVTWEETEDPISFLCELLARAERIALADQTWAVFLLRIQAALPRLAAVPGSSILRELRVRKDEAEIADLREVAAAADRAYERLRREVRFAGRQENEVGRDLAELLRAEGHDAVSFCIVASGPNGASPHHETSSRTIAEGDTVVCDFGGLRAGYASDITRTVFVGDTPPEEVRRVHDVVRRAQQAAYATARPGVPAEEVDRAARQVIAAAGYGEAFLHRTGHGIGLDGHEHPYLVEGNGEPLEVGMVFSIEPGIYLARRFGVRVEDIVALASDGPEPLNTAEHSLALVR